MAGHLGLQKPVSVMLSEETSVCTKQKHFPNYWDMLSKRDQDGYLVLRRKLNDICLQRNRGHRVEAFGIVLEAIRIYIEQKDDENWKRALVCGVYWMDKLVSVNTRQLRFLIPKSKSSINGSLHKLGYTTIVSHADSCKMLAESIPFLKGNYNELRQWTARSPVPPNSIVTGVMLTPISLTSSGANPTLVLPHPIAVAPTVTHQASDQCHGPTFFVQNAIPCQFFARQVPSEMLSRISSPGQRTVAQPVGIIPVNTHSPLTHSQSPKK